MQLGRILILTISIALVSCNQAKYPYGERAFKGLCGDCHMDDGTGVSTLYPSLSGNNIVESFQYIPCIIRHGVDDTTSVIQMLAMPTVSDVDITNIINYILHDLNKSDQEILLTEVKAILENCKPTLIKK